MVKETDLPQDRMLQIAARLAKWAKQAEQRQGGVLEDAEAGRQAKQRLEQLVNERRQKNPEGVKKTAEVWTQSARSGIPEAYQMSQQEIQQQRYDEARLVQAETHYNGVKSNAPDWVKNRKVNTREGMEFAAQIAELPRELQNNPAVLYHKAAILYASVDWTKLDNTTHAELRALLYDSFEEVRQLQADPLTTNASFKPLDGNPTGSLTDKELLLGIYQRADIYRTAKRIEVQEFTELEPIPPDETVQRGKQSFTRPNRNDPAYHKEWVAWKKRRDRSLQQQNLHDFLIETQKELDNPNNRRERQVGVLDGAYKELMSRKKEGLKKEEFSRSFHADDVKNYEEDVKIEYNRLSDALDEEKEYKLKQRENERLKGRALYVMGAKEAQAILNKEQFADWLRRNGRDRPQFIFDRNQRDDAIKISSGPDGLRQFLHEKLFEIYGAGREHERPNLIHQYQWEEVQEYIIWLLGESKGRAALSTYEFLWNNYAGQDYQMKTLLYKPDDLKDKLKALRGFLGADMDKAAQVEFANMTIPQYMQVLSERQGDLAGETVEAELFMRDKVNWTTGNKGAAEYRTNTTEMPDDMTYDQYFMKLRDLHLKGKLERPEAPKAYGRLLELELKAELLAKGTGITDEDLLVYNEVHNQINSAREKIDFLIGGKEKNNPLSPDEEARISALQALINRRTAQLPYFEYRDLQIELTELQARKASGEPWRADDPRQIRMDELEKLIKEKSSMLDYPTNFTAEEIGDGELLSADDLYIRRGYSPLEWEVRRRVKPMVEKKLGIPLGTLGKDDEWRLREAVFAARFIMIGSGHLFTEAAVNVIRPMALQGDLECIEPFAGKSVMWAPVMEDVVRIINPDYFEERYTMGGEVGSRNRAIRRANLLMSKGFAAGGDIKKTIKNTPEYKRLEKLHLSPEERFSRAYIEWARRETGVEAEYMLTQGYTAGGGALDMSLWRPDSGLIDELQKKCVKEGHPEAWKNIALWYQYAQLSGKEPKNIEARMSLLSRALDRGPSKFFQLWGGEIVNKIKSDNGLSNKEWHSFVRALDVTECQLWQDWDLASRDVILRGATRAGAATDDFATLLAPNLQEFGISGGRVETFRKVLWDLYDRANEKGGQQYSSRLDALAHHDFPMTLSYADLDWSVANFFKLGTTVFDRRGRDIINMMQVRDIVFDLDTKAEFVRPHGEKGVAEYIKKLQEMKVPFTSHTDINTVEKGMLEMVRQNLSFNRSRVKNVRNILGWIPGADSIMRGISKVNMEFLPILEHSKRWQTFLKENNLIGKKLHELPHSVAEAVSLAVRFYGPEAEDWDIHRIDHIIDMYEHAGIFSENPKFYSMLRKEFGTTTLNRLLDIPRKYWWVVIAATVSVAVLESMEEEKRQHK